MSKSLERNTNRFSVKKIVFWAVIVLVVTISVFLLIVQNNHFESTTTIDLSAIISENEIKNPFFATCNNSFGICSTEDKLPFYPLITLKNIQDLWFSQKLTEGGMYFCLNSSSEEKPYSSLWYYSEKQKSIKRIMESTKKNYCLESLTYKPDLLVFSVQSSKKGETFLYDAKTDKYFNVPDGYTYLTSRNFFNSNKLNAIIVYKYNPDKSEYFVWDYINQEVKLIGEGKNPDSTFDGSFFIFESPTKPITFIYNCQSDSIVSRSWLDDSTPWKICEETNQLYSYTEIDVFEGINRYKTISSPIEFLDLETMKITKVDSPAPDAEYYNYKLSFNNNLIFGTTKDNVETLWKLNQDFEWDSFFTIDPVLKMYNRYLPSHRFKKTKTKISQDSSFVFDYEFPFNNVISMIFNNKFEMINKVEECVDREMLMVNPARDSNSWSIFRGIGMYCDTIQCHLDRIVTSEIFFPDTNDSYIIEKAEIEKKLLEENLNKPHLDDFYLGSISDNSSCMKINFEVYEDLEKNGFEDSNSNDYFGIVNFKKNKIFTNASNKKLKFKCWIDSLELLLTNE